MAQWLGSSKTHGACIKSTSFNSDKVLAAVLVGCQFNKDHIQSFSVPEVL